MSPPFRIDLLKRLPTQGRRGCHAPLSTALPHPGSPSSFALWVTVWRTSAASTMTWWWSPVSIPQRRSPIVGPTMWSRDVRGAVALQSGAIPQTLFFQLCGGASTAACAALPILRR